LSGGEKTFAAISLLFAILNVRPVPFCLLDEVEAALDDANVESFGEYLNNYKDTQFILITHKKKTMEFINIIKLVISLNIMLASYHLIIVMNIVNTV
jgi:chromosome segregation protein